MNGSRPPTKEELHGGTIAAISGSTVAEIQRTAGSHSTEIGLRAESFDDEIMCPIRFHNRPKGHAVGSTRLGLHLAEGGAGPAHH